MDTLLQVLNLNVQFQTPHGLARAVDNISFELHKNETLGIVGESGCGKSVTALAVMRLLPEPPGRIEGLVNFNGRELLALPGKTMRHIRGNAISMIFQEPMTSLNPVFTIGDQIAETIRLHQGLKRKKAVDRTIEMLQLVGIPSPEKRIWDYPHQMSGGMRQRAMIAMALSCRPQLLIADEPTTALDVTIQAQILELMLQLQEELGMAIIFISHDLGVIAELSSRVLVFYAGRIIEQGRSLDVLNDPQHPYTESLLRSTLTIDHALDAQTSRLPEIIGQVPDPFNFPTGCRFNPRCPEARDRCRIAEPVLAEIRPGHDAACWLHA